MTSVNDNKKAILLNYGMMLNGIESDIREKANFVHRFFVESPELKTDPDLLDIGRAFTDLLTALKRMDKVVSNSFESLE